MQNHENLGLLLHSIEGINRTLALKDLLLKSMEAASIVMNTEASSLMMLDKATGELNVSLPTGPVHEEIRGYKIPKDKGVAGWVLKNKESYFSNNVLESDLFWQDLSAEFKTKNIICASLNDSTGEAIGVIQAINRKNDQPFNDEDVKVFEVLAEIVSTAMERAKEHDILINELEERNLQLSETHHRLKNNLSTISALIELEMPLVQEKRAISLFKETSSRIRSVANLHTLLYRDQISNKIDLKSYLDEVIRNVIKIYNDDNKNIIVNRDICEITLDTNRALLCGLTLNELLVNAYKHAFVMKNEGEISVTVKNIEGERLLMCVTDTGVGVDNSKIGAKGLFIANSFASKLGTKVKQIKKEKVSSAFEVEFAV